MRFSKLALAASALLVLGGLTGCSKVRAQAAFKDGNKFYKEENFKKAIEEYTQAVEYVPEFPEALFFLGSSYQALFRPGNETPENVERIDKAIEFFDKSLFRGFIGKLRELSPLWDMYKEGIDLDTVQWAAH